ncbi:YbaB/EbfC family DNA-binding protein [Nocardia sp. NBC_01377]|uniref:YbaB/EbfC family DNA-binding protein n=1 Tax=Nocardia sp. NBC_01377 TaxID=2903595 RepID=UPI003254913B
MTEDLDRLAHRVAELNAAVGEVRGTSYSPDGSVHIEVDIYGAITRLRLNEFAMEHGPERFAELIIDCHDRAHAAAVIDARSAYESVRAQQDSRGIR